MICKVDGVIFPERQQFHSENYFIFYFTFYLRGYENSWTEPVVDPDTRVLPLLDKLMLERTKLWRSISWTILELEICLRVLSDPTE